MSFAFLAVIVICFLSIAYFTYGTWVRKQFQLDDSSPTPAHTLRDDEDYVPTHPFYLFGQHFSAIAAAGPIAGPILACQSFGWLPCLLWICLGVVFIGAVHDFSSLAASVKHGASSVADIASTHLGRKAGLAMMAFIWIALIYIIVAFTDITAGSFLSAIEEIQGVKIDFNPGGAVAAASILYLSLSLILGLVQRYLKPPMWILTVVFVPLAFASAWAGTLISEFFVFSQTTWIVSIILYCALGSLIPVWLLLQPRGFLGGFILYFSLAIGIFGILFGDYSIQQPAFKGFDVGGMTGSLFPFLFVTIACGACSGFHGLVCSGTTSKQIDKEKHIHPVGYGAMLAEGFVAIIALFVVMMMSDESIKGLKPGTIYGNGLGEFISLLIGKEHLPFAITLGAMAFSTFVFDTLDVSARLGRYLFQELTGLKGRAGSLLGTFLIAALPLVVLLNMKAGSWGQYWTLFGASNQLLAALTLLSVSAWLYHSKRKIWFTLLPMFFVITITMWTLGQMIVGNWKQSQIWYDSAMLNSVAAMLLMLLALFINIKGFQQFRKRR